MATAFKQVADNAQAIVATDLSSPGVTSISVLAGSGAVFPTPGNGFWVTLWNNALYPGAPGSDPSMEKVVCSARSGDTLTVSPTTKSHSPPCSIALLDVAQNTADLQTAINATENNIATNTTAIAAETTRAEAAESNLKTFAIAMAAAL